MDYEPLVSIVMPVYHGANYMREAIDSALAQTYRTLRSSS
jgi:glycosyltransferase involved in cell wall biosynthesis